MTTEQKHDLEQGPVVMENAKDNWWNPGLDSGNESILISCP